MDRQLSHATHDLTVSAGLVSISAQRTLYPLFTCGEAMQVYKSSFFFSSFSSFSFSILQKMSLRSKITIKDTIVDILHHDSDQCDHL